MLKKMSFSFIIIPLFQHISMCLTVFCITIFLHSTVWAKAEEAGDGKRQNRIMGTFSEGMEIGKDEDGNTIIRVEPAPKDTPEQSELPPITIEVHPQIPTQ